MKRDTKKKYVPVTIMSIHTLRRTNTNMSSLYIMLPTKPRLKLIKTNTIKTTPKHNLLLALFDVKYKAERLITGYTGETKYLV